MPVIVLLRHGLSSANTAGILAGRTPGVSLTEDGIRALEATLRMLPHTSFSRLVRSPLQRCAETADIAARFAEVGAAEVDEDLIELDYGEWTGRTLKDLGRTPEWETVSRRASAMRFPSGESIAEAADRGIAAVTRLVDELRGIEAEAATRTDGAEATGGSARTDGAATNHGAPTEHGAAPNDGTATDDASATRDGAATDEDVEPERAWGMVVSHGDIIKAVIADALGMPLDDFQRLAVAPGSFTVIDYSGRVPVMTAMSVTAAGLAEAGVPGGGQLT